MAFYQNLFNEYLGNYVVGDSRAYTLTYKVPQNRNHGEFFICWNAGPYDVSSVLPRLTFNYAFGPDFKNWSSFYVDFGMIASITTEDLVNLLNGDATFEQFFTASIYNGNQVAIRQLKPSTVMRSYVSNSDMELVLCFNKYAGYADMPTYFTKDTIENRFATPESNGHLIRLGKSITGNTVANPTVVTCVNHGFANGDTVFIVNSNSTPSIDGSYTITLIDADTFTIGEDVTTAGNTGDIFSIPEIITLSNAGLNIDDVKQDYEHLGGRCGAFLSTKNTVDGSDRIVSQIIYQTGARSGMLGTKICYTYTNTNKNPDSIFSQPYVLTDADLLGPCTEPELS